MTLSTTADGKVAQSTSGDQPYGVSGPGKRFAPYSSLDDGYHAIAGENCVIFGPPEKDVMLMLGGTVSAGDYLKPDTDGAGTTASTDKDKVGARAMAAGTANQIIPVQLLILERSS